MNFEKVELFGFKSFADKAEIKFGDGVTCIVGPNGCGKSNVADAIRWVLGEQSAKSLRGSHMQDFIFSGTQTRKPLSYCEASLFFDNSNKMFSVDYEEVIITRKLYRSGESEYYINKQPARLRDIVNLLREVGVGKEGYTIIGQGKVEEIMSAKPEDRRVIFEEATGISKFKARKDENERKLDRARENIIRLSDIMSEKSNRLGPLEKQANKAREYNELTTLLRHHELNTYISKVESVGEDKAKINTRIDAINEQSALRNSELEQNEKEYNAIMDEFNSLLKVNSELNSRYTELCLTAEKRAGNNSLIESKIGFLNEQIDRIRTEISKAKEIIETDTHAIENAKKLISEYNEQLKELIAEDEALSIEVATLGEKISVIESFERESNKKIISSIETLTDRKLLKNTADTELNNYSERAEELRSKIDGIDEKREQCYSATDLADKNIISFGRKIEDIRSSIERKENEIRAYNETAAKCDSEVYNLNSNLSTLKTKEAFYRSSKENYEGYGVAVKQLQMRAKQSPEVKSKIKGVVGEIISCEKKFDIAMETALGSAVQNIVTETPDDAKYLIEYLRRNQLGRLTFLPITSVKARDVRRDIIDATNELGALGQATNLVKYDSKFENVISSLLGNTLIADNIENATKIAKKYGFSFKIVTLDGDVIATQGSMTGGSTRKDSHGLLSGDRKLEEIEKQIKEVQTKMNALTDERKKTDQLRDNALVELDKLEEDLQTAKQNKLLEEQKKQGLVQTMADLDVELSSTKQVLAVIEDKINGLILKLKTATGETAELEREKENLSGEVEKNSLETETLKKKKEELSARQTEIKITVNGLHSKIATLNADIENCNVEIIGAKKAVGEYEVSIEEKNAIISDLKTEQSMTAMTNEERLAIEKIKEEIESIEDRSDVLKKSLSEKSEKRQQLQEEITGLSEKKHLQEIALTKIDSDLEYMQQSVWEDYQETYESAQKAKEENYDVKFGMEEIERIRRRRNFLGSINANAIDDYKAELESYQELEVQKQDLEAAETDIREILETIKAEMLTQFDEGFNKINENFGKIFKELFGGGRAMLELDYTNATDKLDAGVEIKVEPPGKKLQKLSLLSGGEKALTAIAILFSILRLKPMAFCVLDEIEAALDEANVDRFARYLKKFSSETQFIVITHRKPTMELADNLFGVTMEEKGVSKLVSVKLSDVVIDEN